jgi:toxin ParE1/3/4
LAASSKKQAEMVVDAILEAVGLLEQFPELGRSVPEMGLPHLRELIVKQYRVVYYLNFQDEIEIVTIRHSASPLNDSSLPLG